MRADVYVFNEMKEKVRLSASDIAYKLIYQWVKEDRINPSQMAELIKTTHSTK